MIAAVAFAIGFTVGARIAWTHRTHLADHELDNLTAALRQAIDDRQRLVNEVAEVHREAIRNRDWQHSARLAHRLEQLEHLLSVNGIKVDL